MHYHIRALTDKHLFEITLSLEFEQSTPNSQMILRMPQWTPGSYQMRAFAKNIVTLDVRCDGNPALLQRIDTHTWSIPNSGNWEVTYQLFAWDASVRAIELSRSGGFINGSALFLSCDGMMDQTHYLHIESPNPLWQLATTMSVIKVDSHGFGAYSAANYDELIDHPLLMGALKILNFSAAGVPHQMVIAHEPEVEPQFDAPRLIENLTRICSTQIHFFGAPAPMPQYQFLLRLKDQGYGGLEHRSSSALVSSRDALPKAGNLNHAQKQFMGLCSHEYFHTWWVKRVKPQKFIPYPLNHETCTSLLWVFEGFTSYYDDLMLLRSGVISQNEYFEILSESINHCFNLPGRRIHSLTASSFEAWIKLYRPDANSSNSQVSYYRQGSLAALAIDLRLRSETKTNLDEVVQALYRIYGDGLTGLAESGEAGLCAHLERMSGLDWKDFFAHYIDGTTELPFTELLPRFGLSLNQSVRALDLGVTTTNRGENLIVKTVASDSVAEQAGLAPEDVLLAVNSIRVTSKNIKKILTPYQWGEKISITFFRDDVLKHSDVVIDAPVLFDYSVSMASPDLSTLSVLSALNAWLHG